jgi:hypothetical protein
MNSAFYICLKKEENVENFYKLRFMWFMCLWQIYYEFYTLNGNILQCGDFIVHFCIEELNWENWCPFLFCSIFTLSSIKIDTSRIKLKFPYERVKWRGSVVIKNNFYCLCNKIKLVMKLFLYSFHHNTSHERNSVK